MQPEAFDSQDVGQIEAFVSKIYSKLHIGAIGETTRARITRRVLSPEIGFDDLDYSFDIGYSGEPPELLIICDVISNTIGTYGEGSEDTFGPGDQFLISRPDLPYAGVAHASRLRFAVLDPAILNRVAEAHNDDPAEPVRLLDHRPVSRQAALRLQRSIAYVRNNLLALPHEAHSPLLVSAASEFLAAGVLCAYPNTAIADTTVRDHRDANPSTVRLAVAFIEVNPDVGISVSDIARAAYVTPRALQLAFRRHLDTTPAAYLRRVRLDHAHDDLDAATAGDGVTVTTVAYRWGFSSPSRFAEHYRAAYGIPPSHTLRR